MAYVESVLKFTDSYGRYLAEYNVFLRKYNTSTYSSLLMSTYRYRVPSCSCRCKRVPDSTFESYVLMYTMATLPPPPSQ